MRIITCLILACLLQSLTSQNKKLVPTGIIQSFEQQYPDVVKYKKTSRKGLYEFAFTLNKLKTICVYDTSGQWTKTISTIPMESIPTKIFYQVRKSHPDATIQNTNKIQTPQELSYEIILNYPEHYFVSTYSSTGTLISNIKKQYGEPMNKKREKDNEFESNEEPLNIED